MLIINRHPLYELSNHNFVPNGVCLTGESASKDASVEVSTSPDDSSDLYANTGLSQSDKARVLIMTGPNYSGKSVFLKQTALIVYMAHIGWYSLKWKLMTDFIWTDRYSFVPATTATIGLTDKILTRIATRETVSNVVQILMSKC